jgi:2-isopropylmalate synthase
MQVSFYQVIQKISETTGKELTVSDITSTFQKTYFLSPHAPRLHLRSFVLSDSHVSSSTLPSGVQTPKQTDEEREESAANSREKEIVAKVAVDGMVQTIRGQGNGPLSSLIDALANHFGLELAIKNYSEHSVGMGSNTRAASFVELTTAEDGAKTANSFWGVGLDVDIAGSGLRAVLGAASSALGDKKLEIMNGSQ